MDRTSLETFLRNLNEKFTVTYDPSSIAITARDSVLVTYESITSVDITASQISIHFVGGRITLYNDTGFFIVICDGKRGF